MIYGSWNIRCNRKKFLSFWSFFALSALENQDFKIEKNTWRYHFTHLHHKWQSYDVWFLRYGVRQTEFFVILDDFLPFYPLMDQENQNFEKMKKSIWRYYCYRNVYHKWQSYDVWFLRYGIQPAEFSVILDHFGHVQKYQTQLCIWRKLKK